MPAKPTASISVNKAGIITLVVTGRKEAKATSEVIMRYWYKSVRRRWQLKPGLPEEGNSPVALARVFTQHGYDVDLEME